MTAGEQHRPARYAVILRRGVPTPETSGSEHPPGGHPGGDSQSGRQDNAGDGPHRRLNQSASEPDPVQQPAAAALGRPRPSRSDLSRVLFTRWRCLTLWAVTTTLGQRAVIPGHTRGLAASGRSGEAFGPLSGGGPPSTSTRSRTTSGADSRPSFRCSQRSFPRDDPLDHGSGTARIQ